MPGAIALFDVDGTVLRGRSAERTFVRFLRNRGELGVADGVRWLSRFLGGIGRGPTRAAFAHRTYLKGKEREHIEDLAEACFRESIAPRISTAARRTIEKHRSEGRDVGLLSGTLAPLLWHFEQELGADWAHGTQLEERDGRYTGEISGPFPFGAAKAEIVRDRLGGVYDLASSWAYADSPADFALLSEFGHAVVANPSPRLERRARALGFETVRF